MLWFRAFGRKSPQEVFGVLVRGDQPHPDRSNSTRQTEAALGIDPPRVYYFLGRTLEEFGNAAVAIDQDLVVGEVSPFDTGGLLGHIKPVCEWSRDEKVSFLKEFTWTSSGLSDLLAAYPGRHRDDIRKYLLAERPTFAGPGDLWPANGGGAPIWREEAKNVWRAWTWECRVVPPDGVQAGLRYWTCSGSQYAELRKYADALTDEAEIRSIADVLPRYVVGGTSELVRQLREQQELRS